MFGSRSSFVLFLAAMFAPLPFLGCSTSISDDHAAGGNAPSETGGAGSGGSSDGEGGEGGEDGTLLSACDQLYVTFRPEGTPTFQQDILPILREQCSAGICHGGEPAKAEGHLWLGRPSDKPLSSDEVTFIYQSLIDVQATAAPKLALVRKERPRDSWLMLKLDSCLDYPELDCALDDESAPCGERMPNVGDELPEQSRNLIRSWIATGATYK